MTLDRLMEETAPGPQVLEGQELKRRIVEMYDDGATVDDISEAVGKGRSSVYYHLKQAGITPNRQKLPEHVEMYKSQVDQLQAALARRDERIADLQTQLDRALGMIDKLLG